jgi:putative transposase
MATLEWVAWFNNQRLLSSIGYISPDEAEENYHKQQSIEAVECQSL